MHMTVWVLFFNELHGKSMFVVGRLIDFTLITVISFVLACKFYRLVSKTSL